MSSNTSFNDKNTSHEPLAIRTSTSDQQATHRMDGDEVDNDTSDGEEIILTPKSSTDRSIPDEQQHQGSRDNISQTPSDHNIRMVQMQTEQMERQNKTFLLQARREQDEQYLRASSASADVSPPQPSSGPLSGGTQLTGQVLRNVYRFNNARENERQQEGKEVDEEKGSIATAVEGTIPANSASSLSVEAPQIPPPLRVSASIKEDGLPEKSQPSLDERNDQDPDNLTSSGVSNDSFGSLSPLGAEYYFKQLMLLEQQNKRRLQMAREEQDARLAASPLFYRPNEGAPLIPQQTQDPLEHQSEERAQKVRPEEEERTQAASFDQSQTSAPSGLTWIHEYQDVVSPDQALQNERVQQARVHNPNFFEPTVQINTEDGSALQDATTQLMLLKRQKEELAQSRAGEAQKSREVSVQSESTDPSSVIEDGNQH